MIPLSEYPLQDFRQKNKLPTLRERDLEFEIERLKARVAKLERQRDRMELA